MKNSNSYLFCPVNGQYYREDGMMMDETHYDHFVESGAYLTEELVRQSVQKYDKPEYGTPISIWNNWLAQFMEGQGVKQEGAAV